MKDYVIIKGKKYLGKDLEAWAESKRRQYHRGTLPQYQKKKLEAIEGWSWDLTQKIDENCEIVRDDDSCYGGTCNILNT